MLHFTRWKTYSIIAAALIALFFAMPNVLPKTYQDWLAAHTIAKPMTLGLDLQGGSNVLMEVDRKELTDNLAKLQAADARVALREAKIAFRVSNTARGVNVSVSKPEDADKAYDALSKLTQPVDAGIFGSGVQSNLFDIQRNGQQINFVFNEKGLDSKISNSVDQVLKIITSRITGSGVVEASIQKQGKDRIVIQLPGVGNPDQIIKNLGNPGVLSFQLLCDSQPAGQANDNPPPECESFPLKEDAKQTLWVKTASNERVDGQDLVDAQPAFDNNHQPVVSFRFNQKGALKFGKLTADNVGKPFAIVLDGVVQSFPRINEPILGGSGQISGNFSVEETNSLAVVLRSGALPAKLVPVEQRTVGPSLGSDSIRAGFVAAVIGLILVVIFMLLAYGIFGVFANIALIVNLIMVVAIMSVVGFTLTLPGIAGIVLTMGMAVDSNVLIYERVREEWRNGRTALSSIETGFKAALATILDANITSFIAAVVLFGVGSGPVRGFAITHAIGIFTTMFTAFTFTRLIVSWWVRTTKPKTIPL